MDAPLIEVSVQPVYCISLKIKKLKDHKVG